MEETMGMRIARYRKEHRLTQEELANKLGVSSQAVSKWENDQSCPDISLLPQLCKILGISTDTLLTGSGGEVRVLPEGQRKALEELTLRVKVDTPQGDRIRVNLPVALVKVAVEMGLDLTGKVGSGEAIKNLDFGKLLDLIERGVVGKLVEVESAEGETVEVVVE